MSTNASIAKIISVAHYFTSFTKGDAVGATGWRLIARQRLYNADVEMREGFTPLRRKSFQIMVRP